MGLLKPVWGSKFENLVGNGGELARNVNTQIGSRGLQDMLSLGKGLAKAATFANYTSAFSTMYSTYKNQNASEDQRAIAKQIEEANGKLSSIEETNTISANIEHQRDFGKSVYDFVSMQTKKNEDENDTAPTVAKPNEPDLNHYFFVLHPSDDWHPAFDAAREKDQKHLPGFMGYTMDRFALGLYLRYMREAIGNGPTFHVLVPSAREYRLPGVVSVDPAICPLIVQGQVTHSGKPYCSATIIGLDGQHIRSVTNLPAPQLFDDQKGGYRVDSDTVTFQAPATLSARCRTHKGTYKQSSIDLDKLLGVKGGAFEVGGKDFSKRVTNVTLDADGATLRAMISQTGGQPEACAINLEAFISNDNGVLRKYGELNPAEKAKAGAKGTSAGLAGMVLGAIGGPPGMVIGAGIAATIAGVGAEEEYKRKKRNEEQK
jgi:hypothetical protein